MNQHAVRIVDLRHILKSTPQNSILTGNRIPRHFFLTSGRGESDIAVHAGSYHLALKQAGIHSYNHIQYSSILPAIAEEVEKPSECVHGSVMETISAVANAKRGTRATAALIFGWIYHRKTREKYGGLVCEYNGNYSIEKAKQSLKASLREIYENGYRENYYLENIRFKAESFVPQKRFGTALVALCFVNYLYPVYSQIDGINFQNSILKNNGSSS